MSLSIQACPPPAHSAGGYGGLYQSERGADIVLAVGCDENERLPNPVLSVSTYSFGAKQVSQNDENERVPNPVLSDSLCSFGAKQMLEIMKSRKS